VAQRCTEVILPDSYLAQLRWGADGWPPNWRQSLARALQDCYPDLLPVTREIEGTVDGEERPVIDRSGNWRLGEVDCPEACPLHGRTDQPHRHFRLMLAEASLGVMKQFISERLATDYVEFNFRNTKRNKEQVSARRK